jgi:hypothetical protein
MKVEIETAKTTDYEVVEYDLDGSPILSDHPRTVDVYTYYDSNGEIIGRMFDDFLWCLIDDSTESKLSAVTHSAGVTLAASDKWRLCWLIHSTFDDARVQFAAGCAIRNQDALKQLISAFEALSGDQSTLMDRYRSNIGVSWREFPLGRKDTPASIFMRTANSFLDKGMLTGKPPTLEGCLSFLRDEMETFFIDLGLDPENKHRTCFDEWMEILLNDPDIKREEAEWRVEKEKSDALLKEKMPEVASGKQRAEERAKGTQTTKQKAQERHKKILYEAHRIDPKHERSANSLFEELAEVFLVKRNRAQAKNTRGETLSYVDTSYWNRGFKKPSIYSLLKKKGWS